MLEEFDCIDKPPHSSLNNPTSLPKPHVVDVSRKQRLVCWPATMPRCSAVLLCPASSARGRCSLSSPRACHLLLCLTCNLAVVSFDGIAWLETTDYLFLRNNMPDLHRLKGQPSKWLHSSYYLSQPVYEVKQDVERMLANVRYLAIYSSYPTCQPFPPSSSPKHRNSPICSGETSGPRQLQRRRVWPGSAVDTKGGGCHPNISQTSEIKELRKTAVRLNSDVCKLCFFLQWTI